MTSAEYIDLRDRLKAIDTTLKAYGAALGAHDVKLSRILDALDEIPSVPPVEPPPVEPPPTNPGDPPITSIQFLDPPSVVSWAPTSQITKVVITPVSGEERIAVVCLEHTKLGQWPAVTPETVTVEGNPWVIFDTPSGLVGCTYEWYRPGQACKSFYIGNLHRSVRQSWQVRSGDRVGFMVSTLARDANRSLNERSQVFWTRWP